MLSPRWQTESDLDLQNEATFRDARPTH